MLGKDNREKEKTLGMISAYISLGNRFEQKDITVYSAKMLTNTREARMFSHNILEEASKQNSEITMTDVLQYSKIMAKQTLQVNMINNCLYQAIGDLVQGKPNRIFGKSNTRI